MAIDVSDFSPVEQTALLTAYARALDNRSPRPILHDTDSDAIIGKIDYDFAALAVPTHVVCQTALRARMLDDRVRDFVARHPDAVIVDLGAGLSTAALRVRPPESVDWYSVDLPAVVAVRNELFPIGPRIHTVSASLTGGDWADAIPAERPAMLIADGLIAFIRPPALAALLRGITGHFRHGEIAFNDYGRLGWTSRTAMKLPRRGMVALLGNVWTNPGFADAATPQTWDPRLQLVEEASLTEAPEVSSFPPLARTLARLARLSGPGRRKARILHYRFG